MKISILVADISADPIISAPMIIYDQLTGDGIFEVHSSKYDHTCELPKLYSILQFGKKF